MKVVSKIENRNYGLDLVRVIAVLSVLFVHFFLNTGFYDYKFDSFMYKGIFSIIRNFLMICVPLFIILTGFLNNKTEYNKKFFKSLLNILIIWFFYSLIEFITLNIINSTTANLNIIEFIKSFTSYEACYYSWYIEMYIGLYLLSPIINNAYKSFDSKNKTYLLYVMFGIFILPPFINKICTGFHLPEWWSYGYPLAYYIFGKYISDKKPVFNKKILLFVVVLAQVFSLLINNLILIEYYTITTFISSIAIFLLVYDVKVKSKFLQKPIKYISNIALDIYLGSSLIDSILYPYFNNYLLNNNISYEHSIVLLPVVGIVVFLLATIYGTIRKFIINVR